jgi:SAM-dependent methyltransferase
MLPKRSPMSRRGLSPRRTAAPPPLEDSFGHLPVGVRVCDRVSYLVERATGRSVIHLGFVDARNMQEKLDSSAWIHAQLADAATRIVGVDADAPGVAAAQGLGYDARVIDCQDIEGVKVANLEPAELVVAAEIIEHLDRPGDFLDAVRPLIAPEGKLIITTPNPTSLTNVLLGLVHREVQNADHVAWHSWRTLQALLERHRYAMVDLAYYRHPRFVASGEEPLSMRVRCSVFNLYQAAIWPLLALSPSLADGVIVMARPR